MKPFLFKEPLLPDGFHFPASYQDLADSGGWPDIEPWRFLALDMPMSLSSYASMLLKFPDRPLIPFAQICDPTGFYNDGYVVLACFESTDATSEPCVRIYDFGNPKKTPWDNLSYKTFSEWLAAATQESLRYKAERAEAEDE